MTAQIGGLQGLGWGQGGVGGRKYKKKQKRQAQASGRWRAFPAVTAAASQVCACVEVTNPLHTFNACVLSDVNYTSIKLTIDRKREFRIKWSL